MTFRHRLTKMNACKEAIDWLGDRDLETAWRECERVDWMLWLAQKIGVDRKLIVLCAVRFAETSLKYATKGDNRPKECCKTVREWLRGRATIEQVRNAAYSAESAAYSAAEGNNLAIVRKTIPLKTIMEAYNR